MTGPVAAPISAIPKSSPREETAPSRDDQLRANAEAFEAVFVAQMLSQTGLAKAFSADAGFGGDAFAGLLVEQYARELTEQGGFGLAEHIYQQMRDKDALNVHRAIP